MAYFGSTRLTPIIFSNLILLDTKHFTPDEIADMIILVAEAMHDPHTPHVMQLQCDMKMLVDIRYASLTGKSHIAQRELNIIRRLAHIPEDLQKKILAILTQYHAPADLPELFNYQNNLNRI